jgi:hypothetical protein
VTDEDVDSYDNVGLAPFWAEHKPFVVILLALFLEIPSPNYYL